VAEAGALVPWAVLGLGSNLGSRRALLSCARDLLAAQPGLSVLASSPLYQTPPLGPPQPDYLNAALKVAWPGSARALLALTQHIEQQLQRQRDLRWGPRTLDIDLLYWSEGEIAEPDLIVPHPGLAERLFARVPLLDVAPELAARFAGAASGEARNFAPSEPFVARATPVQDAIETAPSRDPLELLAALPSALAGFAPAVSSARAVLPFMVPCAASTLSLDRLESPISALSARVGAAFRTGFRVRAAAITEVGEGRLRGVFVGQHDPASRPLPGLNHVLTSGPAGASITIRRT
jgi:2-amino-4-hydroxy-6-hydroxymethyldihydropteridine diphosphokinase